MTVGNTTQEIFANLPDEQELRETPSAETAYTNLHIHLPPNFGSIASVEKAIRRASEEKIAVLGSSNYYDHTIYKTFAKQAVEAGIAPVFGIEVLTMDEDLQAAGTLVNDPKNPGKFYICGKGLTRFDLINDEVLPIWARIREGDKDRIEKTLKKMNDLDLLQQQEIQLSYQEIAQKITEEKQVAIETVFLQERHLAQALQQVIFEKIALAEREGFLRRLYQIEGTVETDDVVKVQNELRTYLLKQGKVAYTEECYINPEEAAKLIIGLGGYVSYPILIDGAPSISPFEGPPEALIEHLSERKIGATEFIPTRNELETLTMYVKRLRKQGFVVGAGTEHNDAVWIPLLPACKHRVSLTDDLVKIFWEGSCVAVAHQYLRAKGKEGFRFLSAAADRHALIEDMAGLGARVIKVL